MFPQCWASASRPLRCRARFDGAGALTESCFSNPQRQRLAERFCRQVHCLGDRRLAAVPVKGNKGSDSSVCEVASRLAGAFAFAALRRLKRGRRVSCREERRLRCSRLPRSHAESTRRRQTSCFRTRRGRWRRVSVADGSSRRGCDAFRVASAGGLRGGAIRLQTLRRKKRRRSFYAGQRRRVVGSRRGPRENETHSGRTNSLSSAAPATLQAHR